MSPWTSVILSLACSWLTPELFLDFFSIFFFLSWAGDCLTALPVCLDPDFTCRILRPRIRQNNSWRVEYGPKMEGFEEPWHGGLLVMFSSVTLNVV